MQRVNLPASLATFIGRDAEVQAVRHLLESSRLVTLTGPGGVGKTRLAVAATAALVDTYEDGVWFVDLAPIVEPEFVARAVVDALGLKEPPSRDGLDWLRTALSGWHCLIVLDNCEHVAEPAAALAEELLRAIGGLHVVATSREALRIPGEVVFQVPPLAVPDPGEQGDPADADAVRLFLDRARAADATFVLDDSMLGTVATICRSLDGLPLAIELAAARARTMHLTQLATGLEDRFRFLTTGARTHAPRHRTLIASVEWSHELLTPEEQAVFRRLGVFAGFFSAAAADAVCSGGEGGLVRDLFLGLVDRSLVAVDRTKVHAPYQLLETLRQFAAMKLDVAGEMHATRDRHLGFYADLVMRAQSNLQGPGVAEAVTALAAEHDNLRAALDWATQHHIDVALGMTAVLATYWYARGHWTEARQRATVALRATDAPPALRGAALAEVARIAATAVDAPNAITFGETALEVGRAAGDDRVVAPALWALGTIYAFLDPPRARRLVAESLEVAQAAGLEALQVRGLTTLGIVETQAGEFNVARAMFDDAAEKARAVGMEPVLAPNRLWLAWTCLGQGDFADAKTAVDEGLRICRGLGSLQFEGYLLSSGAICAAYTGDYPCAHALSDRSRKTAERLSDPSGLAAGLVAASVAAFCAGDLERARSAVAETIPLVRTIGPTWLHAFALLVHSELQRLQGGLDDARAAAHEARLIARGVANRWLDARARAVEARAAVAAGDVADAQRLLHEALPPLHELRAKPDVVAVLETLGATAVVTGEWQEAARFVAAAAALAAQIGYVVPVPLADDARRTREQVAAQLGAAATERAAKEVTAVGVGEIIERASRGRGRRSRPAAGWDSLTPTEMKVAALVAEGLSNPQIAERMFISSRTVQTHLTHMFSKLTIATRSELAVEVTRRARAPN